jgi:leucyl aminopeptidase
MISTSVLALPATASAQSVIGSGVVPSTAENSAERPIEFATRVPRESTLAVVMTSSRIPDGVRLPSDTAARIASADFTGEVGSSLTIPSPAGQPPIILVGAASADGSEPNWRETGGRIVQAMANQPSRLAIAGLPDAQAMAEAGLGATMGQYRFDRYKSARAELPTEPVVIVGRTAIAARSLFAERHGPLSKGVRFARDMVNEPANVIYPESFIARTRDLFSGMDQVSIEVLDEAALRARNMGTILGVGQGSPRGSRLMLITYRGADGAPMVLAGKGITFDTGGISIKPNSGMWEMKGDMSGAAAVTGATYSLAKSGAPVHVVTVVPLAENMPGANAQRPGDVVRTYSGKTIEMRSTDAEGRLVLADAIEYAVDQYEPFALINIATLTGSAFRALGREYAAVFARQDAHAEAAIAAGEKTGEELWQLPLHPNFAKAMNSEVADIKNSDASPAPGASAGAHFIEFFVPDELPWVHVDMANVDRQFVSTPLVPVGGSGFGVLLLDEMARSWRPE